MASNLHIVIVGAGFAGLTAAIECRHRGMKVTLLESYPTSRNYGDILDFSPNGGMHMERWDGGSVARELMEVCLNDTDQFEYFKFDGAKVLEEPFLLKQEHYYRLLAGHRGEMHEIVCNYATRIGVDMRFGEKVVEYIDNDDELAVLTEAGVKYTADVVAASDGPKSLGRTQILGLPENKVNSGYAIYRAHCHITDEHRNHPLIGPLCRKSPNFTGMWVGKDLHMLVYTWKEGKDLAWVFTHKDGDDISESWSFPGNIDDAMAYLEEAKFADICKEIVRLTPTDKIIDYKLVWREPITTWLGKNKRSCAIGDAAHCHLPTSAQGGCQAVEDGVVLAVCLEKALGDVPLALQVFERIRFNRSDVIHRSSITARDDMHYIDWESDFIKEHPEVLNIPRMAWVLDFDAKADAEEHFDQLAADVKSGRKGTIQALSLPATGKFDLSERHYFKESGPKAVDASSQVAPTVVQ
ncbi:salicylate hydroxylase [Dactylonectria macrodidyma]|uniref:Salicylate hydroxylase n=1 Tax=Dactylonectria macrodidyma TaxID=307937 RepID=A0A9P9F924_9HYPO|nr:salicylate hydroxylase [Dactylonectria macrodidyma]